MSVVYVYSVMFKRTWVTSDCHQVSPDRHGKTTRSNCRYRIDKSTAKVKERRLSMRKNGVDIINKISDGGQVLVRLEVVRKRVIHTRELLKHDKAFAILQQKAEDVAVQQCALSLIRDQVAARWPFPSIEKRMKCNIETVKTRENKNTSRIISMFEQERSKRIIASKFQKIATEMVCVDREIAKGTRGLP